MEEIQQRFEAAKDKIITLGSRERDSIGVQKEKTIHAVVKNMLEPDEQYQEVPVGNYIADICRDGQIYEVQTAGWGYLRDKLKAFLPEYKVTCVYPIPHEKWITWINPETGELEKRNRSPQKGSFYQAFRELYRIRPYLDDPNLSILLLLIDMEEYRIRDGYSPDGKHGSHRYDRIPTTLYDVLQLDTPADYAAFLPDNLSEPFTSKDLEKEAGIRRRTISYSQVLQILSGLNLVERTGEKKHNAYLYRRSSLLTRYAAEVSGRQVSRDLLRDR